MTSREIKYPWFRSPEENKRKETLAELAETASYVITHLTTLGLVARDVAKSDKEQLALFFGKNYLSKQEQEKLLSFFYDARKTVIETISRPNSSANGIVGLCRKAYQNIMLKYSPGFSLANYFIPLIEKYQKRISEEPEKVCKEIAEFPDYFLNAAEKITKGYRRWKTLREKALEENMALAWTITNKYAKLFALSFDDAFSASYAGLLNAIDKLDKHRLDTFPMFATTAMIRSIQREAEKNGVIRLPHYFHRRIRNAEKNGDDGELEELLSSIPLLVSLDEEPLEEGRPKTEVIENKNAENPAEEAASKIDTESIREELMNIMKRKLNPREILIVTKRTMNGETLESVASQAGVSKEAIRQMEKRVLRKLSPVIRKSPIIKEYVREYF